MGRPLDAVPAAPPAPAGEPVAFAHNAEAELAALLDFYGIEWAYEPTTFVLEEGADGCPTLAFTPDFHLPAYDCYLEVTTLDQKLVTKKNRKLRLLRERHPNVEVRIIYRRDYEHLLVKYGLALPSQQAARGVRPPKESAGEALGLLGHPLVVGEDDAVGSESGAAARSGAA